MARLTTTLGILLLAPVVSGQLILDEVMIDRDQGGLDMPIPNNISFASGLTNLGDVDNDGVADLAVSAPAWDDRRDPNNILESAGEIAVLLMNPDRTVRDTILIRGGQSGFVGPIEAGALFGIKIAGLGDLDGDGVPDLAASSPGAGVLWILFLNPDGTVKAEQRNNGTDFGIPSGSQFGRGIAVLGDEDQDGRLDLMVGDWNEVYRVSVNSDGTASDVTSVASGSSIFGYAITCLGDLDGNGVTDLAISEPHGDRVYILYRDTFTTELQRVEISSDLNGAYGGFVYNDNDFGRGLMTIEDLNGDGIRELLIGAPSDEARRGVVWLVMLGPDASIRDFRRIARNNGTISGGTPGMGWSLAPLGDLDGNGMTDIAVGVNTLLSGGGRGAIRQFYLGCGDDCDNDGFGDECVGYQDCDVNFEPDSCDIQLGVSSDCNFDAVPDVCQLLGPIELAGATRLFEDSEAWAPGRPKLQFDDGEDLCVEVVILLEDESGTGGILHKGSARTHGYGLVLDQGRVTFSYTDIDRTVYAYTSIDPVVTPGQWTHISLSHTFGIDNTKLYINGEGVPGTWNLPPLAPPYKTGRLYLGSIFNVPGISGVLDELRIWGTRRSQAAVLRDIGRPVDPSHPDLRGYWRFDEDRGRRTQDLAGLAGFTFEDAHWTGRYQCVPCPGDINGDGHVELTELAIILSEFGETGGTYAGDLNRDSTVDLGDLAMLLSVYGERCW